MALASGDFLIYDGSQWNNQPSTSSVAKINGPLGIGLGTLNPAATLHVLSAATQLRLSYDDTHYIAFGVDVGGNLTIFNNPTSADVTFDPQRYLNLGTGSSDAVFIGRSVSTTTVNGQLAVSGSVKTATAAKSANYTLTATDSVIFGTAGAGGITITLPAASASTIGRVYYIYQVDNAGGVVTLAATGGNTINGQTATNAQWQCLRVVGYTSTAWIVSRF
jgi:hypothetical protein